MTRTIATVIFVGLASSIACGGSSPPPKTEDTAASTASSSTEAKPSGDEAKPSDSSSAAPAAPTKDTADTSAQKPAASAGGGADTEGDIKMPKDDPWMAGHQVPAGDVIKTIKPRQAAISACYKAGKKKDASASGEVKVKFVITHDGKVRDWKDDDSSMTDPKVTKCVGEAIKKMTFPKQKSPGDAYGTYSINFGP